MDEKLHVLMVIERLDNRSGATSVVLNYYSQMDLSKFQIDFLVHNKVTEEWRVKVEKLGAKVYEMPRLSGRNMLSYRRQLQKFFNSHRGEYEVIHGNLPNAAFVYLKLAKRVEIPVRILHAHSSRGADVFYKSVRNRILNSIGIKYANARIACSQEAAQYLFGTTENVFMLPNGINMNAFDFDVVKRKNMRKAYGIEDDTMVLGHVGRFVPVKNHQFLIKLVAEYSEQQDVRLILLGDGDERRNIEKLISEYQIGDKVILTGTVSNVQDYLQMMDVFLLPSLFEGLPLVGIEAQAIGLPCIFSDNVTREVAVSKDVFFCSLDDKKTWCDIIDKLNIKDEERAERYKNNVQLLKLAGYDLKTGARKLEKYYIERINRG